MKKGFTLVELLAVIAIVAVLAVFIVPNVLKTFKSSKEGLSRIQKEQILNAATMYINDTCINPISDEYECDSSWGSTKDVNGVIGVDDARIRLDTLVEFGYLDSQIADNCVCEAQDGACINIKRGIMSIDDLNCNFNN